MPTHTANKSKGKATTRRHSYDTSQGALPAPKWAHTADWSNDLGTDGNSAEYHLVQWLIMRSGASMRSDWDRWRKSPKGGNGGWANLHQGAIWYLEEKGCSSQRKPETVKTKITSLRTSYIDAWQFKTSTGAGWLNEEERDSELQSAIYLCQSRTSLSNIFLGKKDDDIEDIKEEDDDKEDKDGADGDRANNRDGEEDDNDDEDGDGEEHPPNAGMAADNEIKGLEKGAKEHTQRHHNEMLLVEKEKMKTEKERMMARKRGSRLRRRRRSKRCWSPN
ncbi:hypothetical protein L202_08369 [Cryptococcus amylolentus CBS 6039]|uniref:Uncharacterized protein n=2 Tax=Cryptococcus amylolentus TaxID=104669 RepID=A0A1E3HB17_9TREE|nr:hypothetical protein L202_08369 [Cryptococcus amylolentus CBS 6039]ODN72966.1 hypothetical protein L202_08369 [Cryptococcus amylolentus CBS 6039]ODN98129.1 hypothetical protein I350_07772 [Cryptococcus amylolentus CBS 6273]